MTITLQSANNFAENYEHLEFMTDSGIGERANLGLIVLRTDQTIEDEFRFVVPESGVGLYHARLHSPVQITASALQAMEGDISKTVSLLPDVKFNVIGFGCTSGALVIGRERIEERVRSVIPGVSVTDPLTAGVAAMKALGVQRVAMLTPYIPAINQQLGAALTARGLTVPVMGSFNEPDDNVVARITPLSVEKAIMKIGASNSCDGVFISCTSMRIARQIRSIEARLGKPVTSSNHAMAWHMLRLAGEKDSRPELGRLFLV